MPRYLSTDIEELFAERIMLIDGAMGTAIQAADLQAEDFGGPEFEGCNEVLVLTQPDLIEQIHRDYLEAGADVIETDSFGATSIVLGEYGLQDRVHRINEAAAALARQVADEFSTAQRPRLVAGSMGPGTKAISVTGGITWDEIVEAYREQARGLLEGGVDILLLETAQDTRNIKAGSIGILHAMDEFGVHVPLMISATIELMGTTLGGQTVDALAVALEHLPIFSIGLNCATGPTFMTDHVRTLAEIAKTRVTCIPNAGLPDEDGQYPESPEMMSAVLGRFAENGWLNAIGGCCGTTPEHVSAFADLCAAHRPRTMPTYRRTQVSGLEYVAVEDGSRPYLIGERTNVLGSRAFKKMIAEGDYERAAEVGRRQVRSGAHIVDVCLQDPDREEITDTRSFLELLTKRIKVPLMLDSTDALVLEAGLEYCQGKAILNSINLEDGEERFQSVVPLAKRYGAALVVGTIDEDPEQGMAVTVERKLEVATRSYDLLTGKYDVPGEDIIWDALVFPIGTGDANYMHAGRATIEGVRALKAAFPDTKTILGISNVSFGLPPAGREVLNSVFLYHCVKAGLDLAIVNTAKLERYASIPAEERALAERLIFDNSDDAIRDFAEVFGGRKAKASVDDRPDMSLDERLSWYIVEGVKDGLIEDLTTTLETSTPLEIINGPLMRGMDEVGRLFNDNQLIVAEVLQSAEAMKRAVGFLEGFMAQSDAHSRGKVILATVKGDVHDIGKNLVDIILSNNGYKVFNLGIKIPPARLIEAVQEHAPDIIGLSGLLVKSAQQMVTTAEDLAAAGIDVPILVGGAALSPKFVRRRITPAYKTGGVLYAKDAMDGLRLANGLMDPEQRVALLAPAQDDAEAPVSEKPQPSQAAAQDKRRSSKPRVDVPVPSPPDRRRHVVEGDPDELFGWISPQLLYGRGLGLRGNYEKLLREGDTRAIELTSTVTEVRALASENGWLRPRCVYQFLTCASEGNTIHVKSPDRADVVESFTFPRQPFEDGLCIADYVTPADSGGGDNLAMFVTTVGDDVLKHVELLKNEGRYLFSHVLGALAYETAEGFAEWIHHRIRAMWGVPDPPDLGMKDVMRAKYRGRRYSFGYPACPDMADQEKMWRLIHPEAIGVDLTESYMMEPEATVSALVFHHPDATYFDVRLR